MHMKNHIIIGLCLLWTGGGAWAQMPHTDKLPPAIDNKAGAYLTAVGNLPVFYSGKEEVKYLASILNHPYMDTSEYREGTLAFDNVVYPHVWMRLNVNRDELIVLTPDKRINVVLQADQVEYAALAECTFFYFQPDNGGKALTKGYYARLFDGAYPVWKRSGKILSETTSGLVLERKFVEKTTYYIYKDGRYHTVSSKGSVVGLFKSHKKELNDFIKQNGLSFNAESRGASIVAVARYYESLNPASR